MMNDTDSKPKTTLANVLNFIAIADLSPSEINMITNAVNGRIKRARATASLQFRVGQRVTFYSDRQLRQVTGVITKVNRSTIKVAEDGSLMCWRCSPGLLKTV